MSETAPMEDPESNGEKSSRQTAPAAAPDSEIGGVTSEQLFAIGKRLKEEEQRAERNAKLEKANAARGDRVGVYEVVSDGGWDPNRIYTDLTLGDKPPLPKRSRSGDLLEISEGCWIPPGHVARQLSEQEAAQANAEGRLTLQAMARLRAVEAPVVVAEAALRRTDSEIVNAEGIVRVALEKVQALKDERERATTRLEAARKPVEDFFSGRSAEWRARALKEAARDRDPLPTSPPEMARAFFPPAAPGDPKTFAVNKETGVIERVR